MAPLAAKHSAAQKARIGLASEHREMRRSTEALTVDAFPTVTLVLVLR